MNTVVLLGTAHSIQLGENAADEFRAVLMEECEKNKVSAIAEEIKKGDITIAWNLAADDYQLEYLYADPDTEERIKRGIPNNIPSDIMREFRDKYPDFMWPREPSKDNLPAEFWEEYSKRTDNAYRMRERIWLEKINCFKIWPLLFICGADHFDEFSKLLKQSEFHVIESYKDWIPS